MSWYCDNSNVQYYWDTTKENCPTFNGGKAKWRNHDINFDTYF